MAGKPDTDKDYCEEPAPVEVDPVEPAMPVFWDGTPGTLRRGMICREGKLSLEVMDIVQCHNGAVIIGIAYANGEQFMWNITKPESHPLSKYDAATEQQRAFILSLWEYDQK